MQRKTLAVSGMACDGCESTVETALDNLEGVTSVEADHETDAVEVVLDTEFDESTLTTAIRDAGYEVES